MAPNIKVSHKKFKNSIKIAYIENMENIEKKNSDIFERKYRIYI